MKITKNSIFTTEIHQKKKPKYSLVWIPVWLASEHSGRLRVSVLFRRGHPLGNQQTVVAVTGSCGVGWGRVGPPGDHGDARHAEARVDLLPSLRFHTGFHSGFQTTGWKLSFPRFRCGGNSEADFHCCLPGKLRGTIWVPVKKPFPGVSWYVFLYILVGVTGRLNFL